MKLPTPIEFDWDSGNQDKNWEKHRVYYREIEEVFSNKGIKIFPDPTHSKKEVRYLALGVTNEEKLLTVIFTIRRSKIRVISARIQSKKERSKYED